MGDAKRKKMAMQEAEKNMPPRPDPQRLEQISTALTKVIGAITSAHGADCLVYASAGAGLLQALGYPATMVAGSAAWRLGKGDGDVISHAIEINQPGTPVYAIGSKGPDTMVGLFHAWIEVGNDLVDFTTFSLGDKAKQLDAVDGGTTCVQWCPQALWAPKNSKNTFMDVRNSYEVGIYRYVRHQEIEKMLAPEVEKIDVQAIVNATLVAFNALEAGNMIKVIGLDNEGGQTLESIRQASPTMTRVKGF